MGNCIINRIQDISGKQDLLTAGNGIDITNNVISNSYVHANATLDLNDIKYTTYFGYVNSASQNKPVANGGYLVSLTNNSDVFQYFTKLDYTAAKDIYVRQFSHNGTDHAWTPWVKLANMDDIQTVTSNVITYGLNTDFCATQTTTSRKYGKIVQFTIKFGGTTNTFTPGKLYVGTLTGDVPSITTYVPIMRHDSEFSVGWLVLPANSGGSVIVYPLNTIPNGVELMASGTYICN